MKSSSDRHRGPARAEGDVSGLSMSEIGPVDHLREAPRFHAYFSHLEGRQVLTMPRREWEQLSRMIRSNEPLEITLSSTPIADVIQESQTAAVVAERQSDAEVILEVCRHDPKDAPNSINRDRYRVWERLPA